MDARTATGGPTRQTRFIIGCSLTVSHFSPRLRSPASCHTGFEADLVTLPAPFFQRFRAVLPQLPGGSPRAETEPAAERGRRARGGASITRHHIAPQVRRQVARKKSGFRMRREA